MNRRGFLCALAGMASTRLAPPQANANLRFDSSVAVDYDQPSRAISKDFMGLSYESAVLAAPGVLSLENRSNSDLIRGLGPGGVLRLGGNSSAFGVWRETGDRTAPAGSFAIEPEALAALSELLEALDWRLIYGLNLARAAPEAMAEEAATVAEMIGPRLLAFQLGNEPDGFGRWSGLRPPSYDFRAFMAEWQKARASIAARVPSARFAGPDIVSDQSWVEPFVEAAGSSLVLVTRHHYADGPAGAPHVSIEKLLGSAPNAQAMLDEMGAIGERHRLPFRIVETNSIFNEGQPGVSDSFASALWGVDFMFRVAVAGGEGINFHAGDAKAYTPIGPEADGRREPRPLYYGMLLFKEAARGARTLPARLTSKSPALTSYATRAEDGALRVCLINMDLQTDARVGIEAGRDFASVSHLRLTAPSAAAKTGVTLGGSAVDTSGNWSAETAETLQWRSDSVVEVPAASAVMVQLRSR